MSSYGFVHLPSLLVFVRPQPPTFSTAARKAVDLVAVDHGDFDEVAARLPNIDEKERQEAVLRLTALSHEIRHFHDFLLTPYGNRLVRDAFWYSILTFGALTELSQGLRDGQKLKVALPTDPLSLPVYGKRLQIMRSAFHERARQGLSLMEANAIHTQIQQAEIDLGRPAAQALSGALRRMGTQYSGTLNHLWQMQQALEISDVEFAPIVLALTLPCLLDEAPMPIERVTGAIVHHAGGRTGTAAARLILSDTAVMIERVASRAISASQQENEKFLDTLDKAVQDPLDRELVKDAFADFTQAAADVQRVFLNDPRLLLDPGHYLREGLAQLISPFVYLVSDGGTTMQTDNRFWEKYLVDPLTYVREYRVNDRTVFELACVPAPAWTRTLNESAWKSFAETFAGSLVIAEGADREHPVEGIWIRKMEKRWNMTFTPFGSRAAWQAAPVGEIV